MKHLIKVVILPTDSSKLYTDCNNKLQLAHKEYSRGSLTGAIFQHLYITVAHDVEPIKEGEFAIYDNGHNNGFVVESVKTSDGIVYRFPNETWKDYDHIDGGMTPLENDVRKIIATTNPKLHICGEDKCTKNVCTFPDCMYPSLQSSFLKEYCANPNGEYEVEYSFKGERCTLCGFGKESNECINRGECPKKYFGGELTFKINQDNTVNITSVEEKMYSGVDLMGNQDGSFDHFLLNSSKFSQEEREIAMDAIHDWIKENL
jgi:hypothetical protein